MQQSDTLALLVVMSVTNMRDKHRIEYRQEPGIDYLITYILQVNQSSNE